MTLAIGIDVDGTTGLGTLVAADPTGPAESQPESGSGPHGRPGVPRSTLLPYGRPLTRGRGQPDVEREHSMSENESTEPTVEGVALVDIDGDGTVDAVTAIIDNGDTVTYVDVDGDGTVDAVIATAEDGTTVIAIDEDGDGSPDVLLIDEDGDGTIDVVATLDENGEVVEVAEVEKAADEA